MKHDNVAFDRMDDEVLERARLDQVLDGLRESPRRIEPIWFYDQRGSALFEQICATPEYYLTRTELGITRTHAADMATALGPRIALIEPGSGASAKTRLLLEALDAPQAYIPIDISREHLRGTARRIKKDYPWLTVQPLCADFTRPFAFPTMALHGATRRVVYFPGSTLGNFARSEAIGFLGRMRALCGPDGAILLGIDRVKAASLLERAYDDAAGITAQFNRNALRHLNRELGATFDLTAFEHRAPWTPEHSRIEMHLVANRDVPFTVGGERFEMARGEYLLTELSHKYTLADATDIARSAGLEVRRAWSDPRDWFSVLLLEPA
jgi:dimethylhistidine N-methyltransferase